MTDLIFLHGWTMRGSIFDPVRSELGGCAPDLPGHGDNSEPASVQACTDLLRDTLWDRGPSVVVGWSMGAAIAWNYIAQHGTTGITGLITLDMSPKPVNSPDWPHGLIGQTAERQAATTREIHSNWPQAAEKIATTMFASTSAAPAFSRNNALAQILSNDAEVMARYWDELMTLDLRDVVKTINVPYLVGYGGKSRVYPASTADWLIHAAPQSQKHCFTQSGHSPHLEEPDSFVRVAREFINTL